MTKPRHPDCVSIYKARKYLGNISHYAILGMIARGELDTVSREWRGEMQPYVTLESLDRLLQAMERQP
jgi:hypothetical protein